MKKLLTQAVGFLFIREGDALITCRKIVFALFIPALVTAIQKKRVYRIVFSSIARLLQKRDFAFRANHKHTEKHKTTSISERVTRALAIVAPTYERTRSCSESN